MTDQPLKIGDIAALLGTSISSLRFYEQKGLVTPARSPGGTRLYNAEQMHRFEALTNLTKTGVPLEAIHALTRHRLENVTGNAASHAVDNNLKSLETQLNQQLEQLQATLKDIQKARRALQDCHGCRKQPRRSVCAPCPVSQKLLRTGIMHLVWDEESGHD